VFHYSSSLDPTVWFLSLGARARSRTGEEGGVSPLLFIISFHVTFFSFVCRSKVIKLFEKFKCDALRKKGPCGKKNNG
jgi:hypothetical protein